VIDAWVDQPPTTYTASRSMTAGDHTVTVEYYENAGGAVAQVSWQATTVTNTPPSPTIAAPAAGTTWKVGDVISFSGSATDAQDGSLPASALSWSLVLQHCPSTCHEHPLQTFAGVASGSFVAPDHDYPSHLELRLTATDSGGLQSTVNVELQPQTTTLTFASSPSGLALVHNGSSATTPFSRTVIVGSNNSMSAPSPQSLNGTGYQFDSWSDQGAVTHNVTAPATATTYTATYQAVPQAPIHVGDLDATKSTINKNFWRTSVTIALHDANEAPISGATVTGTWSGGTAGTATCTTGAAGTCSVSVPKIAVSQPSATFAVTNVAMAGRTYNASANHDPDGDSNGTTIAVTKP
jgi:hypothetical protein